MGTYAALFRSPEQFLIFLCEAAQGAEQERNEHLGQAYIASR